MTGHQDAVFGLALLKVLASWFNKYNASYIIENKKLKKDGSLASSSFDKMIKVWNTNDGSLIRNLIGHESAVMNLAVLDNGFLASGSFDLTIKVWNTTNGTVEKSLTDRYDTVLGLAVLKNGYLAASYGNFD